VLRLELSYHYPRLIIFPTHFKKAFTYTKSLSVELFRYFVRNVQCGHAHIKRIGFSEHGDEDAKVQFHINTEAFAARSRSAISFTEPDCANTHA